MSNEPTPAAYPPQRAEHNGRRYGQSAQADFAAEGHSGANSFAGPSPADALPASPPIAIVDYGAANLLSITRALEAVAAAVTVTSDPDVIDRAPGVVLPGVGAAGAAMANLRASGADEALRRAAAEGRPLLGLCLGMQLFFERLAEDEAEGLGLLAGEVPLLPPGRKIPHMGWNALTWTPSAPGAALFSGLEPGLYAYFVHSYHCVPADPSAVLAWTDYDMPILAAIAAPPSFMTRTVPRPSMAETANDGMPRPSMAGTAQTTIWGLQFHPEKSGAPGLRMLANWVALARAGGASPTGGTSLPTAASLGRRQNG